MVVSANHRLFDVDANAHEFECHLAAQLVHGEQVLAIPAGEVGHEA